MAFTKKLIKSKAKAKLSPEGRITREFTEQWLIVSDVAMTDYALGTALGYVLGQRHGDDPRAFLTDYELDRQEGKVEPSCTWDVSLMWNTLTAPTYNNSDDPLQARVKRSFNTQEHTLYVYQDRNGDMILNGAKQPFDGGIPVTLELPTYTYIRNEPTFSGTYATAWSNSLNSDYFNGCGPKTLKLKVSTEETFESDSVYFPVKYEMAFLQIGWQPQPLNAGIQQLISNKLKPCYDNNNLPVQSPVPLTVDGEQVDIADLPSGANFIEVDWFALRPYGSLGLQQFT